MVWGLRFRVAPALDSCSKSAGCSSNICEVCGLVCIEFVRVWDMRIWGVWFRAFCQRVRVRVYGLGFRVQSLGFELQDVGYRI